MQIFSFAIYLLIMLVFLIHKTSVMVSSFAFIVRKSFPTLRAYQYSSIFFKKNLVYSIHTYLISIKRSYG